MNGTNAIGALERIGAVQNVNATTGYRNDTDSLFQLKAAGDRFAQILGINQNDTPLARGTLREAIAQYAAQNNIDPQQVELISKVFSNELDIKAGKTIIDGNSNTLPTLKDAARSTAFERNPSKVESFADISKPNTKAENAAARLQSEGESAARNAVSLVSGFREMPHTSSLPTAGEFSVSQNAGLDKLIAQAANGIGRSSAYPNGTMSTNNAATLQNAREVVNDIRTIAGTDAKIAETGKKNGALAELDSAIDAWAKKNNIPAGIVSIVKAEIAADIGTYNGKLITASDEAGKLALAKFPVINVPGFGDLNAGKRADYAQEVKTELQSQNGAVLDKLEASQLRNLISAPHQHTMTSEYNTNTDGKSHPSVQEQEGGDLVVDGDDEDDDVSGDEGTDEVGGDDYHALGDMFDTDAPDQIALLDPQYWESYKNQDNAPIDPIQVADITNPQVNKSA
jgi:hypothetical protein